MGNVEKRADLAIELKSSVRRRNIEETLDLYWNVLVSLSW
jgi:hypothetical protein